MFDFPAVDQLELSGKPATIQTVIDALWADDFHEQEPMTGAPEVCLCWVCQSLVPALKQVEQAHASELAALRERVAELENIAKIFRKVLAEEYIELCYFGKNERATRDWIDRVITPAEGGE